MIRLDHAAVLGLLDASYDEERTEEEWFSRLSATFMRACDARSMSFNRYRAGYEGGVFRLESATD